MAKTSRVAYREIDTHMRAKKLQTIFLTVLIALLSSGFIAGMIYWGYASGRFMR